MTNDLKLDMVKNKSVVTWLASGCLLVISMVVIGGITRLTHSGLSMVEWSLIMGSIPPLSEEAWQKVFAQYQQFPEYKLINYHFTLEEFKSIFWWEYIHRMIGRLIGIVFLVPFVYFLIRKQLSRRLIKQLLVVFILGAFQGFLGWYMVKSGLVRDPSVSHYRLASHLSMAFLLYGFLFWVVLENILGRRSGSSANAWLNNGAMILLALSIIQIIYGAFVSGLKAGFLYNTWPKMGDRWIAESVGYAFGTDGFISLFANHASVQFVHRSLAFAIVLTILHVLYWSKKHQLTDVQKRAVYLTVIAVLIQFVLGIFTLVFAVPVALGVLHQFGALVLLTALVNLIFQSYPKYTK